MTTTMPRATAPRSITDSRIERTGARVPWPNPTIGDAREAPASGGHQRGRLVVVGYSGSAASLAALSWAAGATSGADRILVVHATCTPITVRNGPSNEVAERLGNPEWATVRSTVDRMIGRERADTLVEHGTPAEVLARHGQIADLVVLGRRRRGNRSFRRLLDKVPCAVVGIRPDGEHPHRTTSSPGEFDRTADAGTAVAHVRDVELDGGSPRGALA